MASPFPKAANFVQFLYDHPCARPWWVYVETFIPAYLQLFITISIFDAEDIMRAFAKGKAYERISGARGGSRHTRKPRMQNKPTGTQIFTQRGLRTLLIVTEPLELIGFVWLLYSGTEQFFYNWQSMLMESPYCTTPVDTGPFYRSRAPGLFIGILPEGSATPLPILNQDRAGWGSGGFSVSLPPGLFRGLYAVEIQAPPGGLTGVHARLRIGAGVFETLIDGPATDLAAGETGSFLVSGTFFIPIIIGGGSMGWELVGPAVPAGVLCNGAHAMCSLTQ